MKILSAKQIKEADVFTIREQNIYGHELMERAAKVVSNWIEKYFPFFQSIHIIAGTGNNGADGLCVARHLFLSGKKIRVFIVGSIENASDDFILNYGRLIRLMPNNMFVLEAADTNFGSDCDCILDCLFGYGINRTPDGIYAEAIKQINDSEAFTISIDMPSGLYPDIPTPHPCVEADITLSFEFPKLCFFFPENKKYTGEWLIKKIGLSQKFISTVEVDYFYLTEENIAGKIKHRNQFAHKGNFGHVLVIGGQEGMTGAAQLCGLASLMTGAGKVTITANDEIQPYPELMTTTLKNASEQISANKFNALAIGPGLGNENNITLLLENLLPKIQFPIVLDADALNCLSKNKILLEKIPENSILTPHPTEFERLFRKYENWDDLIEQLRANATRYRCFIVYKRAYSIIATPKGKIYFNSTGNAGMATAGSGDVLTGIIAGLIAQNYSPEDATILGVYLHGFAGDLIMLETDGSNLIAGDLISTIQKAFGVILSYSST